MASPDLERLCGDWIAHKGGAAGVQRLQAWFAGRAFSRHRHDVYAIGLTDSGAQGFWYRGASHTSAPGQVVVLHPDEVHDGYARTGEGFGYRILYIEPARISAAAQAIAGRALGLPFVADPVVESTALRAAIEEAFESELLPLAADAAIFAVTEALLGRTRTPVAKEARMAPAALRMARELLDDSDRPFVRSEDLEAASGLSRFELARQFRRHLGTSPYRYSVMRRLERSRDLIGARPLADIALQVGFSDQAHFTRKFKSAFGVTPGRYASLKR
jgi:AraC-like DNA-binding protein